mmetsp:Transcript_28564/g.92173  ORF Transcript_28564/g.92173 Transcript_28564/m.92173 type:complete len:100 (-) Transcript_28564:436-735(-)
MMMMLLLMMMMESRSDPEGMEKVDKSKEDVGQEKAQGFDSKGQDLAKHNELRDVHCCQTYTSLSGAIVIPGDVYYYIQPDRADIVNLRLRLLATVILPE